MLNMYYTYTHPKQKQIYLNAPNRKPPNPRPLKTDAWKMKQKSFWAIGLKQRQKIRQ